MPNAAITTVLFLFCEFGKRGMLSGNENKKRVVFVVGADGRLRIDGH